MSKAQVLTLWFIAAVLGIAVIAVKATQNTGTESVTAYDRGEKLLPDLPAREVSTVTVEGPDESVTIRKEDNQWIVSERDNYPANTNMLGEFLNTLVELEAAQGLEAGTSYDSRFGMDNAASTAEDHGLHVTFNDANGKELAKIALGKNSRAGGADPFSMMGGGGSSGRYVRVHTDPDSVYVVEETFPRISAAPKDWLKEDFLRVKNIKRITLKATDDASFEPWSIVRSDVNGDFMFETLTDAEEMNTSATNPLKNLFSYGSFEDVVSEEEAAKLRNSDQARQVIINTFDGFTYTIDMAPKRAAEPKDEEATPPSTGDENYLLTIQVSADLPDKRSPAADEKPEDAQKKDEEFAKKQEDLKQQLAEQKKLEGRVFEVTKWSVNPVLKNRSDLVQAKTEPEPAPAPTPPATTPPVPAPNPNPPFLQP